MQCVSSFVLALAASATIVLGAPAPAPTAAASPFASGPEQAVSVTSTAAPSIATPAPAFKKARGATIDAFDAQCTVGSDSVATCTGAVHPTNVWVGVLAATIASSNVSATARKTILGYHANLVCLVVVVEL